MKIQIMKIQIMDMKLCQWNKIKMMKKPNILIKKFI